MCEDTILEHFNAELSKLILARPQVLPSLVYSTKSEFLINQTHGADHFYVLKPQSNNNSKQNIMIFFN